MFLMVIEHVIFVGAFFTLSIVYGKNYTQVACGWWQ
jgi:hypothetical protein